VFKTIKKENMNWTNCKIDTDESVNLSKMATNSGIKNPDKKAFKIKLTRCIEDISDLQNKLYAENRQSLLIIFQGMDSSGKDGTIKSIMQGVNPQGVVVHSFKHPSNIELEHDYLWRHAQAMPEHGQITIFNRSHYENVLISKVHPELVLAEQLPDVKTVADIDKKFWHNRYNQINEFEKRTVQNGTSILKFFLHLSKQEQNKRFLDRIAHKEKHWKFSSSDITERAFWSDYEAAYEQAFAHTSTKIAPWYVIPADDKFYTHLLIAKIIAEKLTAMNPHFPDINNEEKALMAEAKIQLLKENQ
jgi:PPK2 family polyphosphate:nucleotide phosphotransferase